MPSASQRSSVRTFRRNSAASSSFVRKSKRIGSELDMAISCASLSTQHSTFADLREREDFTIFRGLFPRTFARRNLIRLQFRCA